MKAVILAGGLGSRLSEETVLRPKPMIEIGGRPILWHIMKGYSAHGINDFVVCLGYKGGMIKSYFAEYHLQMSDVTFDLANRQTHVHEDRSEAWRVTLVDTGLQTLTGGRLKRVMPHLRNETEFCFTYGDGVSNVNITELIAFHRSHGRLATVTGVQPPGRFGNLHVEGARVTGFVEKPESHGGWINGGFFVLSPKVAELIADDQVTWEHEPLERLAKQDQLRVFFHSGFWQPMDTMRDLTLLTELWEKGHPPWRTWD